jgi:hypothetical protein
VEGIRGRVSKQLWKASWLTRDSAVEENRQKACEQKHLLPESLKTYEAMFRRAPTSYYNGDNAAALACLYVHLTGGAPPLAPTSDEAQRELDDILFLNP